MGKKDVIRFDNITREERYFTATILPYLFSYNDFEGFLKFEDFLYQKGYIVNRSYNKNSFQLLTEINLERDLAYYKIEIPLEAFDKKLQTQSKPDLLLISDIALYLFEGKVFTNESEYKLYQQIQRQKYIFDIITKVSQYNFINKLHFLILPYAYNIENCIVLTWEILYEIFAEIIPSTNYFLLRLKNGIDRLYK